MPINELKNIISGLKNYNNDHIEDQTERRSNSRKLSLWDVRLEKISRAKGTRMALGIFGPSQCGKSYLTSELIGGEKTKLKINGIDNKRFQDYNQRDINSEATAVVTRLTQDPGEHGIPEKNVIVKYMTPSDVMWSFVWGFYYEMGAEKGFDISDEQKDDIRQSISLDDTSTRYLINVGLFAKEFEACQRWIKNEIHVNLKMADLAADYFNDNEQVSIEKYVTLVSTLWNSDKNITNAFRARIETLYDIGFTQDGSIPEHLLEAVMDAAGMTNVSGIHDPQNRFGANNGHVINANMTSTQIANLQSIIKEICLVTEPVEDALTHEIDILDFPGARSVTGIAGGIDAQQLDAMVDTGNFEYIADAYKRGKLLYLFNLYTDNHEITLLLLCAENGNMEAKIISKMLDKWINLYTGDKVEEKDPSLFVAFTKSDNLVKIGDLEEPENAEKRIAKRFNENFKSAGFGSWTHNFLDTENPFRNIYLVRNPQATNDCFNFNNGTETWRNEDFKNASATLRSAYINNPFVDEHLGVNKEIIFDNVFQPGSDGIEYLKENILNKFSSDPDKKQNHLRSLTNNIFSDLGSFTKSYLPQDENAAIDTEKKLAQEFLDHLTDPNRYENLSLLINSLMNDCPEDNYLFDLINEAQAPVRGPLQLGNPLRRSVPEFIDKWFQKASNNSDLCEKTEIESSALERYFDKMNKYISNQGELEAIYSAFSDDNQLNDPEIIKFIRNYLFWHVGEKIYYLEHKELNGTPNDAVTMPETFDFHKFILEDIWNSQLPEIYAENYTMRMPTVGDGELLAINQKLNALKD